ncbi:hypothetical protein [Desulfoplanes sp.]
MRAIRRIVQPLPDQFPLLEAQKITLSHLDLARLDACLQAHYTDWFGKICSIATARKDYLHTRRDNDRALNVWVIAG